MSCKSAIYAAIQTSGNVVINDAPGATLPLGTAVRRFGCDLQLSGNGIVAMSRGYYSVAATVTVTPATAGTYTLGLLKDGAQVPGATQTVTATAGAPVSFNVIALVRNPCCDAASTLTLSLTTSATLPATVTTDNVAIAVEKV